MPYILMVVLPACGPNKKTNTMSYDYEKKMLEIYKLEKRYTSNPLFGLQYAKWNCFFELYLNDMPAYADYSPGRSDGNRWDLTSVLSSGKQYIKIKVFPKAEDNEMGKMIAKDAGLKIRFYKEEIDNLSRDKEFTFLNFEMPPITVDTPYLEFHLAFEANVPYKLKGWINSVDLSKEKPERLRQEVYSMYACFEKAFASGDINQVCKMLYNKQLELSQVFYSTLRENSKETVDDFRNEMNITTGVMNHDDARMEIFGDGKVVGLVWCKGEKRGLNGVAFETSDGGLTLYSLLLHRPQAGGPLEIIR